MSHIETPARRTLLQRIFRGGIGRPLINLWVTEKTTGCGQRTIDTRLNLGRYTMLHWERIHTDLDQFDRS
jgi:hypothetical protein